MGQRRGNTNGPLIPGCVYVAAAILMLIVFALIQLIEKGCIGC